MIRKTLISAITCAVWFGVQAWRDRPPPGLIRRLPAEEGNLSTVVFSRDGTRLAAGAAEDRLTQLISAT